MRRKILVSAPVLTRSGYGEHGRFVLRSLRTREDLFDIYVIPTNWGETGWITTDDEEREWIDKKIKDTSFFAQQGGKFDVSIQVTIPNEWRQMAPINIGVTAGIETTRVAPHWLEKAKEVDRIIVVSEHSKNTFKDTIYESPHNNGVDPEYNVQLFCARPIDVIHYPVKKFDKLPDLGLDLDYDFNYLVVAQQGPRKNLENTIRWFIEENIDHKVGLVVKTFIKNTSVTDRAHTKSMITNIVNNYPDRECKVHLLHGEMTDAEMHALYAHPHIKCLVSLTHGEGFGLPLFEAAYSGMPIIAPGWSGHCDFLYAPLQGSKKKKKGKHPYFAEVEYSLGPVQEEAVWDGVVQRDSMWCYPQEGSYKMRLRQVRKNHDKWKKKAGTLQKWIIKNFKEEDMMEKFAKIAYGSEFPAIESPIEIDLVEHD